MPALKYFVPLSESGILAEVDDFLEDLKSCSTEREVKDRTEVFEDFVKDNVDQKDQEEVLTELFEEREHTLKDCVKHPSQCIPTLDEKPTLLSSDGCRYCQDIAGTGMTDDMFDAAMLCFSQIAACKDVACVDLQAGVCMVLHKLFDEFDQWTGDDNHAKRNQKDTLKDAIGSARAMALSPGQQDLGVKDVVLDDNLWCPSFPELIYFEPEQGVIDATRAYLTQVSLCQTKECVEDYSDDFKDFVKAKDEEGALNSMQEKALNLIIHERKRNVGDCRRDVFKCIPTIDEKPLLLDEDLHPYVKSVHLTKMPKEMFKAAHAFLSQIAACSTEECVEAQEDAAMEFHKHLDDHDRWTDKSQKDAFKDAVEDTSEVTKDEIDHCEKRDTGEVQLHVLVEHDGALLPDVDPDGDGNDDEILRMGQAFAEAYRKVNAPNSMRCDNSYGRRVLKVHAQPKTPFYSHVETVNRLGRMDFVYTVTAETLLDDCDRLFDEDAKSEEDRELFVFEKKGASSSKCQCPSGAEDRGPTEKEFLKAFDTVVKRYVSRGLLKHIRTVNAAVGLQAVACSPPEMEANHHVIVDLGVQNTEDDKPWIELAFKDAYNTIAKFYCDPANTRVEETELCEVHSTNDRYVHRALRGRKLGSSTRLFKTKRRVSRSTKLFNDGSDSRKLPGHHGVTKDAEDVEDSQTCYCPFYPLGYGPPDVYAVRDALQETLKLEKEEMVLEENYNVKELIDEDY